MESFRVKKLLIHFLISMFLWSQYSLASNVTNEPKIQDIKDEIILSVNEIQKGCSKGKSYNTGMTAISLISLKKWCGLDRKLTIDSTEKRICTFLNSINIDDRKTKCALGVISKKYSEDDLSSPFQVYLKKYNCISDASICFQDFLNYFAGTMKGKIKDCQEDDKFIYEAYCDFFKNPEAYIENTKLTNEREYDARVKLSQFSVVGD